MEEVEAAYDIYEREYGDVKKGRIADCITRAKPGWGMRISELVVASPLICDVSWKSKRVGLGRPCWHARVDAFSFQ